MKYSEEILEISAVLLIALISGGAASKLHNVWHGMYGTGQASIIGITAILSIFAVTGYRLWVDLTEVEWSKAIEALTFASTAVVHYLSHGVLPSFQAVGGVVFALFFVGTVLNYVARPEGLEL